MITPTEEEGRLTEAGSHGACLRCVAAATRLTADEVFAIAKSAQEEPDLVVEIVEPYVCPLCAATDRAVTIRRRTVAA